MNNRKHDDETIDNAALLLGQGVTIAETSKQTGISERQLYRYRQDNEFRESVSVYRRQALSTATGMMATSLPLIVQELVKLATTAEDEKVRIAACRTMLGNFSTMLQASGELEMVEAMTAHYQQLMDQGLVH